jgi:hypothetical protein
MSEFYSKHLKLWPEYNRLKFISLIETDVSEAMVATQLGLLKS